MSRDERIAESIARQHEWVYPVPPQVVEFLDAHGADREGFQELIRASQPLAPMLQQALCMDIARHYIDAVKVSAAAIARAKS